MLPVEEALRAQWAADGCRCRDPFPIIESWRPLRVVHEDRCRYVTLIEERAAAPRGDGQVPLR